MSALRFAALALAFTAAFASPPARADIEPPALGLGLPTPANLYGLELNQWYVFANHVSAGTQIDGALSQDGGLLALPGNLSRSADDAQTSGSKIASAFAHVSPISLGALASARDMLDSTSTATLAIGYSMLSFAAVLDQGQDVHFDIRLSGQLRTTGDRLGGIAGSGAAVAAVAYGSPADMSTENQAAIGHAAGLDFFGDSLLTQLSTLKSSTQLNLDAFGAQTSALDRNLDVDTMLHVTANGTQLQCNTPISPACGRYFFLLNVVLFTGAQDGGVADFSHSLSISSVSVGGGAALPFNAVSAVPEPTNAALLIAGLVALVGLVRRQRAFTAP